MKKILSFFGVIVALIILFGVTYFMPEPTEVSKALVLFGTVLALVSLKIWVMS